MERLIFHVDVNSAFLSWEATRRVSLGEEDIRLIPSAIGGDREKRTGVILAKSIPAKKFGIRTGEPVAMALRKCPDLFLARPDFRLYEASSKAFIEICKQYAPVVEQVSIDECFLDMSGTHRIYPDPIAIATTIKDKIRDELGFTVNVGIGDCKLLAKMASDFEKPDKIHTLFPEEIPQKLWPLPVGDLFTVGAATAQKLQKAYLSTIGDLAKADPQLLRRKLGKHGETIWHYANGRNAELVTPEPAENKGYGNSVTTAQDVTTHQQGYQVLLSLCETVASRMRKDGKCGSCVCVHLRTNEFHHFSHQTVLTGSTNITSEIFDAACRIFDEAWDGVTPLRQLGVQMTRLTGEPYQQYDLFSGMSPERYERKIKLDETVDALRDKFGEEIIRRAKFAQKPGEHMMGGLDKARRTGVTKPVPDEF